MSSLPQQKKIIIIEPIIAHYRKDIFQYLLESNKFEIEIIGGKVYEGIKTIDGQFTLFNHKSFTLFKHRFYYLKNSLSYIIKKKPDIIICGGFDPHLLHTIILFIWLKLFKNTTFLWWTHGTSGKQGKFGLLFRRFFYKNSDGAVTYSMEGKTNLLKMGLAKDRLQVVNNALNIEDYGYLNNDIQKHNTGNTIKLLYSGRLTIPKKVDVLLEAIKIIKKKGIQKVKLYIIGDGDLEYLKDLSSKLNIQNEVEFIGAKYGKDVHTYFLQSDLFIYPGGIGLSIVHAMSFGLPVITTDDKNLHFPEFEILKEGVNGDLFKNDSAIDLAQKIFEWKNKITQNRDFYVKNCIESIKENGYLPWNVANTIIEFLENKIANVQ